MRPMVTARAYAKINLSLHVGPRRADGYHDLRTVFQALGLHDTISCARRRGPMALRCRQPDVPCDGRNLAWRAAEAMWRALGRDGPVRDLVLTINKRIPVQAGLGGGSADAAATLVALDRLWQARLSPERVLALAAALGADVPFFLVGGTALGLGRGEQLYPLADLPSRHVVIAVPSVRISTAVAYAWHDAEARQRVPSGAQGAPWPHVALRGTNDLEPLVVRRHPVIGELKAALIEARAETAAMSGTGSAVFGLFGSERTARAAARRVRRFGVRSFVTRTLTRRAYARGARPIQPAGAGG